MWVSIFEKGDEHHRHCRAPRRRARGAHGQGVGSHRSTADPGVTHIGDELAVARALRRLADQLVATAEHEIEQTTGEHDVVVRAR